VSDPEAYQGWLAPDADAELVDVVIGDPGAEAEIAIMLPADERIPWSGHSGRWPPRR
jgi:ATP-dependent Lhr-like helicase